MPIDDWKPRWNWTKSLIDRGDFFRGDGELFLPASLRQVPATPNLDDLLADHARNSASVEPEDFVPDLDVIGAVPERRMVSLACAPTRTRSARAGRRLIEVFRRTELNEAMARATADRASNTDKGRAIRVMRELDFALRNDGKREIPRLSKIGQRLSKIRQDFPNFAAIVQHLTEELALAAAGKPQGFRVRPILLNGVPGIGKTAFAQAIAEELGLPFSKIAAGGVQHAAKIVGTSHHWANACVGEIFKLLAGNDSAVAVLLLDEVDKLPAGGDYSAVPALLDLLEPETARNFRDESLEVTMDASHLIVLMTANDAARIDPALRSRVTRFDIREPNQDERRAIATKFHKQLAAGTGKRITLDGEALDNLVGMDIDLRELTAVIRKGFARALLDKCSVSRPVASIEPMRQQIGFVRDR